MISDEPVAPSRVHPKLPRDLETICLKCLEKDRHRRYHTAAALADDLHRFLSGEPIAARPPAPWERGVKWMKRRPAVAALLTVGLVALLTVAGVILRTNARVKRERDFAIHQESIANQEREAAQKAQAEADAQRTRTEEAFSQSIDIVDKFVTRISENKIIRQAGMEPVRKELLGEALEYYQQFIRRWGDHPTIRQRLGPAYFQVGNLLHAIGPRSEALAAYEQAREIFEPLVRAQPAAIPIKYELARCTINMGDLQAEFGDLPAALKSAQTAIGLFQELAEADPSDGRFPRGLAIARSNLAEAQAELGQLQEAMGNFRLVLDSTAALDQSDRFFPILRARIFCQIGKLQLLQQQLVEAQESFHQAVQMQEQLVQDYPSDIGLQGDLSITYLAIGVLHRTQREYKLAGEMFDRAQIGRAHV